MKVRLKKCAYHGGGLHPSVVDAVRKFGSLRFVHLRHSEWNFESLTSVPSVLAYIPSIDVIWLGSDLVIEIPDELIKKG